MSNPHDKQYKAVMQEEGKVHVYNDGIIMAEKPVGSALTGGSTPHQYAVPEGAKEIQDLIEFREMNFAVGNIFKAAYRLGRKEGVSNEYDLNKIIFFAKRELERLNAK